MVSIRSAQSFVPTNFTLPNQLMTQAGSFADELKKWQGIYDNYAQQEYKQQMIDRLKAENERRQQQDAIGEMYKQQLVDAVNSYNGDINSEDFSNKMLSLFASRGDLKGLNSFLGNQQRAKGKGGTPKLSVSERNAERTRGYLSQAKGMGGDTLTNAINVAFNNGDIKSAKELVELRNKLNKSNGGDNEVDDLAKEVGIQLPNGNAPTQEFKASNDPEVKNISEQTAKELGLPIVGKPVYDPRTNTYYKIK